MNQPGPNTFSPQGVKPVAIKGAGPQLGRLMPVGVAQQIADPTAPARDVQSQQAGPVQPAQAQISPPNAPRGAQSVALAGQAPPSAPPVPPRQAPYFGARGVAEQPRQQLAGPESEVHVISVKGLGEDGREYVAEFDAIFPRNTKILGVTERMG